MFSAESLAPGKSSVSVNSCYCWHSHLRTQVSVPKQAMAGPDITSESQSLMEARNVIGFSCLLGSHFLPLWSLEIIRWFYSPLCQWFLDTHTQSWHSTGAPVLPLKQSTAGAPGTHPSHHCQSCLDGPCLLGGITGLVLWGWLTIIPITLLSIFTRKFLFLSPWVITAPDLCRLVGRPISRITLILIQIQATPLELEKFLTYSEL